MRTVQSVKPVGKREVYDITVEDAEHYILENGVVTHNTGGIYSANQIFIITKAQEKEGTELKGYKFTINIEKSRYVREKSKFPFIAKYESGIDKWSGLLDIAIEGNFVVKPSMGWYSKVDPETGEIEDKKYRAKDTSNAAFWLPIISDPKFNEYLHNRYQVGSTKIVDDGEYSVYDDLEEE